MHSSAWVCIMNCNSLLVIGDDHHVERADRVTLKAVAVSSFLEETRRKTYHFLTVTLMLLVQPLLLRQLFIVGALKAMLTKHVKKHPVLECIFLLSFTIQWLLHWFSIKCMFNKLLTDRNTVKNAKRVPRPGKMCVVRFALDSYMLARGAEQLEFKMILFLFFPLIFPHLHLWISHTNGHIQAPWC